MYYVDNLKVVHILQPILSMLSTNSTLNRWVKLLINSIIKKVIHNL